MLPLLLSLRLREAERESWDGSLLRPGLRIDLDESFMEEDAESREVKQMNSSLVLLLLLLLPVLRWGLSDSIFLSFFFVFHSVLAIEGEEVFATERKRKRKREIEKGLMEGDEMLVVLSKE
jgi:hypothetical protein